MKGSDYIAQFLAEQGIKHVFVLTGGACAHMIDSCAQNTSLEVVCTQHEQSAAMAADGYARVHESGLGAAMATSGPGATNLITGIASAWFDSIPVLYITGQVNTFESKGDLGIRQMGFQETDIVSMTTSITKFSKMIKDPKDLKKTLQEATFIAQTGRKGPVVVDIPFNIQTADIDIDSLESFKKPIVEHDLSDIDFDLLLSKLKNAKRPALLIGGGVRLADAQEEVLNLIEKLKIPTVVSWTGFDVIPETNPYYVGQIGVYGARAANITLQNSDFLLSIGSRLDSRQTGGNYKSFAREAFKVVVDIDNSELTKKRVNADMPVCKDAKVFIEGLLSKLNNFSSDSVDWMNEAAKVKKDLPIYDNKNLEKEFVNPYRFMDVISKKLSDEALIYSDTGATVSWTFQGLQTKPKQRVISAFGNSPMGFSLPAAIGGYLAKPSNDVLAIIGDGGMQINLQELQTIVNYKLPIKIIIMNNKGYGIIKQFQDLYLDGRHIATGEGYSCPDFKKIAAAYEINYNCIENDLQLEKMLTEPLKSKMPQIIDVMVRPNQKIEPKLGWGRPIEDQLPLLPRERFKELLHIKPLEVSKSANFNEIN